MALSVKDNVIDRIPIKVFGFRPYDEAVVKALTVDLYPDPADDTVVLNIPPVFGGLQREFSTQEALDPNADPQENIKTEKTIKLPASALSRQGWEFDSTRWSRADYNQIKWTEDGNRVLQSPHPMPYEILYQLDLWTKYRSTMNQFVHRVLIKFVNREMWLPIDIGEPWGVKRVALRLSFGGPQDLTNLDLDELDDRTFRTTISFSLDAWLFPDITSVPSVRTINISDSGTVSKYVAKLPPA
jgi:hypothetical protein